MFAKALQRLQEALNHHADEIQHEFINVSEQLKTYPRRIQEADAEGRLTLQAEQAALQQRQQQLAEDINLWRDRARAVLRQPGDKQLQAFLEELKATEPEPVRAAAERALHIMHAPPAELEKLAEELAAPVTKSNTPAGRLIERACTEYDLRVVDSKARRAAAIEFANRPGMVSDDAALAELEAALQHPDPLARETITQTVIQLHRLRALRVADLDVGHNSVRRLREIKDPAVVSVFIEVLKTPRTGFVLSENDPVEADNSRTRRVALGGLVEWRTPEAQQALRQCQFDRDPQIVKLAAVALEMYPGEWRGPTPETHKAPPV
ncbi:MAG: hypothetical protein NZM11_01270 [Anaerolineales bacterium]|nr:hypothetical protein [Anaerolineales bacterium]